MKMHHRVPPSAGFSNMEGKLDDDYLREVNRSTTKLEAAFAKAQKRVEDAAKRANQAKHRADSVTADKAKKIAQKEYNIALQILEQREYELKELERMMTSVPSGAKHRGVKSHRHIPFKN